MPIDESDRISRSLSHLAFLDLFLVVACVIAAFSWAALAAYVLDVQQRRVEARAVVAHALDTLASAAVRGLPLGARVAHVEPLLRGASREMLLYAATDRETPREHLDVLAVCFVERWGLAALERDAESHRTRREQWRRAKALEILFRQRHPRRMELLARAVDDGGADVASTAVSLLGGADDAEAADILVSALKRRRYSASQIAVQLDRSPRHLGAQLRSMLADADPVVRRWGASLLGRYRDLDGLEADLAPLTDDRDPRVRKAAIQSLGEIGDRVAAAAATRLLGDPVAFVRAAAARAIGHLDRTDLAEPVAALLGDRDWWVRFAAKECLESMGADVWPVLAHCLEHPDRFVRNGAAEVFQNVGALDSFIVMEAATDRPGAVKIEMLRRIVAAGGLRFTDSLVERAGTVGPRVRVLLANIGLDYVGAA